MKLRGDFRFRVRVEMHLPEAFTRVRILDIANGSHWWDIPTDSIPLHLRPIGSQFLVMSPRFTVEHFDTPDEIRQMCREVQVAELSNNDKEIP